MSPRPPITTRKAREIKIASVRAITREDLPRLLGPRDKSMSLPGRIRDSHHDVARLLAFGHSHAKVSEITGYSFNRISQLATSPAMKELISQYRGKIDEIWAENVDAYAKLALRNMVAAERQISDRLDEADAEGETLPVRDLIAISRDAADRFGYSKKETRVNLNVDFAAQLENAIKRSGKQIEGVAQPSPSRSATLGPFPRPASEAGATPKQTVSSLPSPSAPAPPRPFLRRIA